jgi:tyrosyl-tRNA synthetase
MKIEEVLTRYVDKIYPSKEQFLKVLNSGKKLTIYHGVDPTGPQLHLGHSTNYLLLRFLQDLGHKIIFLIGDFTARIGDPSDKNATRKPLSENQIKENLKNYKQQIEKIISFQKPNAAEIRFNSEWFDQIALKDFFGLTFNFTAQQMIERDLFQKRIKEGKPLSLNEFFYPIFQAYDSVALKVDAEIGGTDQTFNMLIGRTLVERLLNKEKFVITTPLLINPKTNQKMMSKTEGNYIALNDTPKEISGKIMALPDENIIPCFEMCTIVPLQSINSLEKKLSPMDLKKRLAFEIVKMYHSEKDAKNAEKEFERVFQKGKPPLHHILIYDIKKEMTEKTDIIDVLTKSDLVSSRSEAKRLISQGGVDIDGTPITSHLSHLTIEEGTIIRAGKRKFLKIHLV